MLKQKNSTSKPPCKNGSFIYIYKLLTFKKRIFVQCIKKKKIFQKGTTYRIQQAISKAINTTGPSVVTFCIVYHNPHPPARP